MIDPTLDHWLQTMITNSILNDKLQDMTHIICLQVKLSESFQHLNNDCYFKAVTPSGIVAWEEFGLHCNNELLKV